MTPPRRTAARIPAGYPRLSGQIREVIAVYAARRPESGIVMLCEPRSVELRFYPLAGNPKWSGNNGKICYPDQSAGHLAAHAINALPGATPVEPYECPRGGHYHHVDKARRRRQAVSIIRAITDAARRTAGQ